MAKEDYGTGLIFQDKSMISIQQKSRVHTSTFGTRIAAVSYQLDEPNYDFIFLILKILFVVLDHDNLTRC